MKKKNPAAFLPFYHCRTYATVTDTVMVVISVDRTLEKTHSVVRVARAIKPSRQYHALGRSTSSRLYPTFTEGQKSLLWLLVPSTSLNCKRLPDVGCRRLHVVQRRRVQGQRSPITWHQGNHWTERWLMSPVVQERN